MKNCPAIHPRPAPGTRTETTTSAIIACIGAMCRLAMIAAIVGAPAVSAETHRLPLFIGETVSGQTGVLRIHNESDVSGELAIYAIADDGTKTGPATLTLAASAAVEFEASDLESGNSQNGLTGGLGMLQGDVRLEIFTDLSVKILAYLRTADGTRSVLHDEVLAQTAAQGDGYEYHVPVFNPAQNMAQTSRLRLINTSGEPAMVMIEGLDDTGVAALGGTVRLALVAAGARTLTAQELEAGGSGLTGQFGAGAGRWRLVVTSDQPLVVVNLATTSTGRLDNLSSIGPDGLAPTDHGVFGERFVAEKIEMNAGSEQWTLEILAQDMFTETTASALPRAESMRTRSGSYTYRRASPNAGRLAMTYMDGDSCTVNLHYTSLIGGWYAWRCDSADYPQGDWRGGNWTVLDMAAPTKPEPGTPVPRLPTSANPGDQNYPLGATISPLTLPAATGGNGTLTYGLAGEVSGLAFDPATRRLTGTPTEVGVQAMKYTVTDMDGDSDSLRFLIVVRESGSTDCLLELLLHPGESCTYPGTSDAFSVNADGSARFLIISSTRAINLPYRTYQGQVYDFRASHQSDGVWRIDRIEGIEAPPVDTTPRFLNSDFPSDQTYVVGMAIEALTLPAATRGEGTLTYSLSPAVPGLAFDALMRQLGGTPTQADTNSMTYRVTDADGDSDSLSFTITVEEAIEIPDLRVEPPTVSDSTQNTDQSFTLSASVHNQGTSESTATTLRYYRSSDMAISSADLEIGTDSVGALSPQATSEHSTSLRAPSVAGTYYYGACVDSVLDEADTNNNCSTAVRVIVAEPPRVPDLVVESPSVSDSSLTPSQNFTLSVTVRNQGPVQSASTTLRYYRSSSAKISDSDTEIGTDSVAILVASGTSFESIRVAGPSNTGTYYYGACVQAVASESETENNCSTGVQVTVRTSNPVSGDSDFDIDIVYGDSNASAGLRSAIASGAAVWESVITRDLHDVDFSNDPSNTPCTNSVDFSGRVDDLRVYVYVEDIDGQGDTLASAGMCTLRDGSGLPVISLITFDAADVTGLSAATLRGVAIHELAHTLGFGILWNGLMNPSLQGGIPADPPPDTHWPGSKAVAAFNAAGGSNYQGGKVPVENEFGGSGSQDRHWRLSVMSGELMTYTLSGLALSAITIQSIADLGYSVDVGVANAFSLSAPPTIFAVEDEQPLRCEIEVQEMQFVSEILRM